MRGIQQGSRLPHRIYNCASRAKNQNSMETPGYDTIYKCNTDRKCLKILSGGARRQGLRRKKDIGRGDLVSEGNPHKGRRNISASGGPRRSGRQRNPDRLDHLYTVKRGPRNIGKFNHDGICSVNSKSATAGCRENWGGGRMGHFRGLDQRAFLNSTDSPIFAEFNCDGLSNLVGF